MERSSHPNAVSGLANLTVAVADAAKVAGWYRVLTSSEGAAIENRDLDAAGTRRFHLGPHQLDIVSPRGPNMANRGISAALETLGLYQSDP